MIKIKMSSTYSFCRLLLTSLHAPMRLSHHRPPFKRGRPPSTAYQPAVRASWTPYRSFHSLLYNSPTTGTRMRRTLPVFHSLSKWRQKNSCYILIKDNKIDTYDKEIKCYFSYYITRHQMSTVWPVDGLKDNVLKCQNV
jgi:hypothetical protein